MKQGLFAVLVVLTVAGSTLSAVANTDTDGVECKGKSRLWWVPINEGEGPDTVLDFALLADGETIAHTAGFSGAAYDIAYVVYTAPLPPAS